VSFQDVLNHDSGMPPRGMLGNRSREQLLAALVRESMQIEREG
jgi:hypothetical protein